LQEGAAGRPTRGLQAVGHPGRYRTRNPCLRRAGISVFRHLPRYLKPWFVCPVRGERVAVLYLRAGRFACRHCQRVAYGSQSGDTCDRTWRKQAKAESKLGPNWQRPKGMHEKTRERLLSIIFACEERRDVALGSYLDSLLRRYPSLNEDRMFR
jgi:hypothetical protein